MKLRYAKGQKGKAFNHNMHCFQRFLETPAADIFREDEDAMSALNNLCVMGYLQVNYNFPHPEQTTFSINTMLDETDDDFAMGAN